MYIKAQKLKINVCTKETAMLRHCCQMDMVATDLIHYGHPQCGIIFCYKLSQNLNYHRMPTTCMLAT